jgi:hypothetical protein
MVSIGCSAAVLFLCARLAVSENCHEKRSHGQVAGYIEQA